MRMKEVLSVVLLLGILQGLSCTRLSDAPNDQTAPNDNRKHSYFIIYNICLPFISFIGF